MLPLELKIKAKHRNCSRCRGCDHATLNFYTVVSLQADLRNAAGELAGRKHNMAKYKLKALDAYVTWMPRGKRKKGKTAAPLPRKDLMALKWNFATLRTGREIAVRGLDHALVVVEFDLKEVDKEHVDVLRIRSAKQDAVLREPNITQAPSSPPAKLTKLQVARRKSEVVDTAGIHLPPRRQGRRHL
jgi:hypothetical protein